MAVECLPMPLHTKVRRGGGRVEGRRGMIVAPARAKSARAAVAPKVSAKGGLGRRAHAKKSRGSKRRPVFKSVPQLPPAPTYNLVGYAKALRFLSSLTDYERLRIVRYNTNTFDLDRMRTLLRRLGNPQDRFKSVHIAGTKGKGSTCAMTAGMLRSNGYKTGMYTSPHLVD